MDLKSCMITLFILVLLFAEPGSSKEGLDSEAYDIDYRGPETHSQRPPPKRTGGSRNFKNHPRSKRQITQNKLTKGKKFNK
ncbi:uncharacterized protein LOC112519353 [Cynara cardunculus var. scolymus]|uniref:uncharacterized protein LOC112519353 n=1 Tax=Cynara cardunculus var. scolymus TaxID=59895 RepID=UPI000D62B75D|nr:uncharacterized protein LOC112519353 [Cynara cardunculus var. scolymus]